MTVPFTVWGELKSPLDGNRGGSYQQHDVRRHAHVPRNPHVAPDASEKFFSCGTMLTEIKGAFMMELFKDLLFVPSDPAGPDRGQWDGWGEWPGFLMAALW